MNASAEANAEANARLFLVKKARGDFLPLHEPTTEEKEQEKEWREELEMLLSRTEDTFDLPLEAKVQRDDRGAVIGYLTPPGSPTIRVKLRLTEAEMRVLHRLQRQSARAQRRAHLAIAAEKEPDQEDLNEQTEAELGIIALVTVNPDITVEWLRTNITRLSALDLATVILDNYANLSRETEEVVAAAKFRQDGRRAGLRGHAPLSKDPPPG